MDSRICPIRRSICSLLFNPERIAALARGSNKNRLSGFTPRRDKMRSMGTPASYKTILAAARRLNPETKAVPAPPFPCRWCLPIMKGANVTAATHIRDPNFRRPVMAPTSNQALPSVEILCPTGKPGIPQLGYFEIYAISAELDAGGTCLRFGWHSALRLSLAPCLHPRCCSIHTDRPPLLLTPGALFAIQASVTVIVSTGLPASAVFLALSRDEPRSRKYFTLVAGQIQVGAAFEAGKKPSRRSSERGPFYSRNAIYSSSSALVGAALLKSLAGRTVFSPGNGTLYPVASYQS
jgi:hypothetical protein